MNERLQRIYQKLGIKFDQSATPSASCAMVKAGFCSGHNKCSAHSVLEDQAESGGIKDKRLESATQNTVDTAIGKGCNVLTKN